MIAGLILAAGESRRMGSDKALLVYRGRTFLETLIANLHDAGIESVIVVLGHHGEAIRTAVDLARVRVVENHDYRQGQTSSLQAGLAALAGESPEAVILCLVDHPVITSEVFRTLTEHFERARPPVLIPTHEGEHGHPIVISQALFPELLALPLDAAANTVIRKYRAATVFVEIADSGILIDVDDPEAYTRLVEENKIVE